jgi:hypothetical protein
MNPLLLTDGYKTGHHQQYPKGNNFSLLKLHTTK